MGIRVSVASFKKGFSKDLPVPERLLAFADWVKKVPRGALGWFNAIASEPLDVTYTDNEEATKALRKSLGIFLSLPDGSRLALWNHGKAKAPPAVVLLGSEGELATLAPDLDTFLLAWAKGKSGVDELDEDGEVASLRPALAKWLAAAGAKPTKTPVPSFKAWFDKVVKENTSAKQRAKEDRAAEEALASADPVDTDLASVSEGVPAGVTVPLRLERFAKWLGKTGQGGLTDSDLGVYGFAHSLVNDDRVDAKLRRSLAFFMRARDIVNDDEVALALWFYDPKKAPVVIARADDDDWRSVAIDLDTLLFAWSRGKTGVNELDHGGVAKVRAELGAWLAREGATDQGAKAKAPDVRVWIKKVRAAAALAARKQADAGKTAGASKRASAVTGGKPGKPPADMTERIPAAHGVYIFKSERFGRVVVKSGGAYLKCVKPEVLLGPRAVERSFFIGESLDQGRLDRAAALLDTLETLDARAREAIAAERDDVPGYIEFHLEELDGGVLREAFAMDPSAVDRATFLARLDLVGVAIHAQKPAAFELVLDYSLGRQYSDQLLAVHFDVKGRAVCVSYES